MLLTDGAIHSLDYFDSYFSQVYTPRDTVTAATFADDVAKGLWTYSGKVTLSDAESLVFRYYTDEGVLIKSESVSIVSDGEDGKDGQDGQNAIVMTSASTPAGSYVGQIGMYAGHFYQWNGSEWILQDTATTADIVEYTPKYLGMFESYPSGAHAGDWCILSGSGILYLYSGSSWSAITDYADSQYTRLFMAAMGDLFALAKSTGEQLFVSRLVALTAFIQTLFSKQIVISADGTISSETYASGSSGFKISGNGSAEFNQGTFNSGNFNSGNFDNITVNQGTFNGIKINNTQNIFTNSVSGQMTFTDFLNSIVTKTGVSCFGSIIATFRDSNVGSNEARYKTLLFFPDNFAFSRGDYADLEGNFLILDEYGTTSGSTYTRNYYIPMICRGRFYITTSQAQLIFTYFPISHIARPNITNKTITISFDYQNIIACRLCY